MTIGRGVRQIAVTFNRILEDATVTDKTIWRLPTVLARTGLSRSTVYAQVGRGEFPEPINIGPRAVGWLAEDVTSWLTHKVEQSRSASRSKRMAVQVKDQRDTK